jgi:guanyl-specific ribonuclease Sa
VGGPVKRAFLIGLALALGLVALAVALPYLRARFLATGAGTAPPPATPGPIVPSAPASPPPSPPSPPSPAARVEEAKASLKTLGKPKLDAQIREVVESMDRSGRPPVGVAQGGRRGGKRGVFENAERRLPVRPPGYYHESDVWPPRTAGRGAERLIFGREGEVYFSPDHYRAFERLR